MTARPGLRLRKAFTQSSVLSPQSSPVNRVAIDRRNSALAVARRWAAQVQRAQSQPDKRRAARKVVDALLVAINGKPCDRTHPLELSRKARG